MSLRRCDNCGELLDCVNMRGFAVFCSVCDMNIELREKASAWCRR
jgi:hypothetical protein